MAAKQNAPKHAVKGKKGTRATKAASERPKRVTALDAAARVLAEAGKPMSCGELIAEMAAKKYWTSPAGKTPGSTLYAAIMREVNTKRTAARFKKTDRGQFACRESA